MKRPRETSFRRKRKTEAPPPPQAPASVIEIQISLPREQRHALKAALTQALAGEPGAWRVRVSSKLVYSTPTAGSFWIKLTLTSPQGKTFTALLDPEKPTPQKIAQAITDAVRRT